MSTASREKALAILAARREKAASSDNTATKTKDTTTGSRERALEILANLRAAKGEEEKNAVREHNAKAAALNTAYDAVNGTNKVSAPAYTPMQERAAERIGVSLPSSAADVSSALTQLKKTVSNDVATEAQNKAADDAALMAYDADSGKAEIDRLESIFSLPKRIAENEGWISNYKAGVYNGQYEDRAMLDAEYASRSKALEDDMREYTAYMEQSGGDISDLKELIASKKQYHDSALYAQEYGKWVDHIRTEPDFNTYSNSGAANELSDRGALTLYGLDITENKDGDLAHADYGDKYKLMNDKEREAYNYYYSKYGKAKAAEYLKMLENTLNSRQAKRLTSAHNNTAIEPIVRALRGTESGVEGFKGAVAAIKGDTDKRPTSPLAYASGEMGADNTGIFKVVNDAAEAVGGMAPTIAASMIHPTVGIAAMGVSSGGNAYTAMLERGGTVEEARGYGLLVGASEATLQYLMGGISKLGGNGISKAAKAIAPGAVDKIANVLNAVTKNAPKWLTTLGGVVNEIGKEGAEEALQTVLEPLFESWVTKEAYKAPDFEEVAYSALLGALTSFVFEGAGKTPQIVGGIAKDTLNGTLKALTGNDTATRYMKDKLGYSGRAETDAGAIEDTQYNPNTPITGFDEDVETDTATNDKLTEGMSELAATAMKEGMEIVGEENAVDFAADYRTAYQAGRIGMPLESVNENGTSTLTEGQIKAAYELGKADAKAEKSQTSAKSEQDTDTLDIFEDAEGILTDEELEEMHTYLAEDAADATEVTEGDIEIRQSGTTLTPTEFSKRKALADKAKTDTEKSGIMEGVSDKNIRIAKTMSKVFGRKVLFVSDSYRYRGSANKAKGVIYVNAKWGNVASQILVHELTHTAEVSKHYNGLLNSVKGLYAAQNLDWSKALDNMLADETYIKQYESEGRVFDKAAAERELVARKLEEVLGDEAKLTQFVKDNRNWATRTIAWIRNKIKGFANVKLSAEEFETLQYMRDIENKLAKALRDTKGTSKAASKSVKYDTDSAAGMHGGKGVIYMLAKDNGESSLKEQIKANLDKINSMPSVADITYTPISKRDLYIKITEAFEKIGYHIDRQNFGDIKISKDHVREGIGYLNTESEKGAMFAVPAVLKRGSIIGGHTNHKGRGYDTVTIAAPVTINGKTGSMAVAVMVDKDRRRYQVHRILMPDGSEFILDVQKNNAESTLGELSLTNKRAPINSASNSSISQKTDSVNPSDEEFSLATDEDLRRQAIRMLQDGVSAKQVYEETGFFIDDKGRIRNDADDVDGSTDQSGEPLSQREIFANALEALTTNPAEKEALAKYKADIEKMNAEENKLKRLKAERRELSFAKGKRDMARIKALGEEIVKTQNRIDIYDAQLMKLEAAGPLREYISAERSKAYTTAMKKAAAKAKESDTKWREKKLGLINRERIIRLVKRMDKLYSKPTKENNIKEDAREFVGDVMTLAKVVFAEKPERRDVASLEFPYATEKELVELTRYRELLTQREQIEMDIAAEMNAEAEGIEPSTNADEAPSVNSDGAELDAIEREIASLEDLLDPLFDRKLAELQSINASAIIGKLADSYGRFANAKEGYIRMAYDEDAHAFLNSLKDNDKLKGKTAKEMTAAELETVYNAFSVAINAIYHSNRLFNESKTAGVVGAATNVIMEIGSQKNKQNRNKLERAFRAFGKTELGQGASRFLKWQNLKPETAIELLGSEELTRLYRAMQNGEETWAVDIDEAAKYKDKCTEKYGADKWDRTELFEFTTNDGIKFELTLGQVMSVYALSKRKQAYEHLKIGGIVPKKIVDKLWNKHKSKVGKPGVDGEIKDAKELLEVIRGEATNYKVSDELVAVITSKLNTEQKAFCDAMQKYLSQDMAAKGNEVSMKLYGIKLFGEEFYFPLKSAPQYMVGKFEAQKGEKKIKNKGFTQNTVEHARNPVVVDDFMDVWAGHVREMSEYHALTLPMEDFTRVYGYIENASEKMSGISVRAQIENVWGKNATEYIETFLMQLNGGIRTDRSGISEKLVSISKKSAVLGSLSVAVQQPTAMIRATAYIDPLYFLGGKISRTEQARMWEELKQYCPIAKVKEMGRFDVRTGRTVEADLAGEKTRFAKAMSKTDDILGIAASKLDEVAWCNIWAACQREAAKKNGLALGTKANKEAAAKRFTEVVRKTQVYDSVFSRSQAMRSTNQFDVMATAFMSEPTTIVNMMVYAARRFADGDKKFLARTIASVLASHLVNSAFKAVVYAIRDDDNDETFAEKYTQAATTSVLDGLNPFTYIPYVNNVWSLIEGYDVERTDIAVIGDLIDAIKSWDSEKKSIDRKVIDTVGAVAAIFPGLPVNNLAREAYGIFNFASTITSGVPNTELGTWQAFKSSLQESLLMKPDSKSDVLYQAATGDKAHLARMRTTYKTVSTYETALKKSLREHDERIRAAAEAHIDGNVRRYADIIEEIAKEGNFSKELLLEAIKAEINAVLDESNTDDETGKDDGNWWDNYGDVEVSSIYSASDIGAALDGGDSKLAKDIVTELVKAARENGKTISEAKSSVRSSVTSYYKDAYIAAYMSKDSAEMLRIRKAMYATGLYDDVGETVGGWIKNSRKK